jgi:GH35 family endo-1,4-beta-xylanase
MKARKFYISLIISFFVLLTACTSESPDNAADEVRDTVIPPQTAEIILETLTTAGENTAEDTEVIPDEIIMEPLNATSDNGVMKVVTGENQWEGIRISGKNMNIEMGNRYGFTFRVYTPMAGNGSVGLIFQANTENGWRWDAVATKEATDLQPEGWHEMTGVLDLTEDRPTVTGLPMLVLTKLGDGGVYDRQTVTFFVDDFTVTDLSNGETIFFDDFERTRTLFENNGGAITLVPESAIYELPEERLPKGEHALNVPSLKEIYEDYFLIGNIINPGNLNDNAREREFYAVLKHHYNALTFENDMKPDAMWRDMPGSFDRPPLPTERLREMDGWLTLLADDGFEIIGHALVWHGQSPNWLNLASGVRSNETAVYKTHTESRENLEIFINTIAGHYYDHPDGLRIHTWDVVNEAVRRNGSHPMDEEHWGYHTIGAIWPSTWSSPWYRAYDNHPPEGANPWDYIYDAFYFARKADPSAILYYNDYNMEEPAKVQMTVNMVNAVNLLWAQSEGNPQGNRDFTSVQAYLDAGGRLLIEGIGLQQHDTVAGDAHFRRLENAIQAYITTGAKISITELDVGIPGYQRGDVLSPEDELKQALHYARLFEIFKRYSDTIERVSFWGVHDARSWRSDTLCLIFDPYLHTKLAYYAVADPEGFLENNR